MKTKPACTVITAIEAGVSRFRAILWFALLTISLLSLPVVARATEIQSAAATATDYLPEAALIDQASHPVSFASLKGKNPVLVGFIHASCQGVCEMLTAKMKDVSKELDPSFSTKVTMVSVTTDPKEDRPAELMTYAKAQGTVGPGWLFLTGKRKQVARILKTYNVPEGDPGDELTHVNDLYLIGADGHQLHHYNGTDITAAAVAADVRNALAHR